MDHSEKLTRYVANFVDELVNSGLTHVVISPGSRSTPLAMTMCEHDGINEWVIIDERSAAFFALGIAKQTKRPVAILCTSGTAAANYYPAIVEAYYSRVPLVILTADRPHELRDIGAPQAIEQIKMYGDSVKWFHEMALPEASPHMLRYVRSKAAQAIYKAVEGNAGPVHLNFPFREPLIPNFAIENLWGSNNQSFHPTFEGTKRLSRERMNDLFSRLENKQKGLIVCGAQVDEDFANAVASLADVWNLPILADPLSQIRAGLHDKANIIENYDAFLKNAEIRKQLKPDFIIRFGAMPISKSYLFFMKENEEVLQFVVEPNEGFRDPVANPTEFIYAEPTVLCHDLVHMSHNRKMNAKWLKKWQHANNIAKKHVLHGSEQVITEGEAVRSLLEIIPSESCLYVGNSMAVRDVDTFFMATEKQISILANRGVSGIDGMVSSALGAAATTEKHVTLLLGDLSFYHDLNGLLTAKQNNINLTILLVNNDGGGIFSFLPQANYEKHFEALFGTPLGIEFEKVISMYGGKYILAKDNTELHEALAQSYQTHQGVTVVEVRTDRKVNLDWRRKKWLDIEKELLMGEW